MPNESATRMIRVMEALEVNNYQHFTSCLKKNRFVCRGKGLLYILNFTFHRETVVVTAGESNGQPTRKTVIKKTLLSRLSLSYGSVSGPR